MVAGGRPAKGQWSGRPPPSLPRDLWDCQAPYRPLNRADPTWARGGGRGLPPRVWLTWWGGGEALSCPVSNPVLLWPLGCALAFSQPRRTNPKHPTRRRMLSWVAFPV